MSLTPLNLTLLFVVCALVAIRAAAELDKYYGMGNAFLSRKRFSIWLWPVARILIVLIASGLIYLPLATLQLLMAESIAAGTFQMALASGLVVGLLPHCSFTNALSWRRGMLETGLHWVADQVSYEWRNYFYDRVGTRLIGFSPLYLKAIRIAIERDALAVAGRQPWIGPAGISELRYILKQIRNSPNSQYEIARETAFILVSWIGFEETEELLERSLQVFARLQAQRNKAPHRIISWFGRIPFERLNEWVPQWASANGISPRNLRAIERLSARLAASQWPDPYRSVLVGGFVCQRLGRASAAGLSFPWRKSTVNLTELIH